MWETVLIKVFVIVENLLGIYRNFSSLSAKMKSLATAQIAFFTIGSLGNCLQWTITTCHFSGFLVCSLIASHSLLSTAMFTAAVLNGIRYRESFEALTTSMHNVHEYVQDGPTYKRLMKKLTVTCVITVAAVTLFQESIRLSVSFNDSEVLRPDAQISYLGFLQAFFSFWVECCLIVELLMLNCLLSIIVVYLRCLKTNLITISSSVKEANNTGGGERYCQILKDLTEWMSAYKCISSCIEVLERCYGTQILLSISVLEIYFIGLSYDWIQALASGIPERLKHVKPAIIFLLYYCAVLVSLPYNGQNIINQSSNLYRLMCRLYSQTSNTGVVDLRRLVSNIHKQMTPQPLQLRVLSNTAVSMSLLMLVVSTAVSNTIVLLQFTHIV